MNFFKSDSTSLTCTIYEDIIIENKRLESYLNKLEVITKIHTMELFWIKNKRIKSSI